MRVKYLYSKYCSSKNRFIIRKQETSRTLRILRSRSLSQRGQIRHNRCFKRFLLSRFTKQISIDSFEYFLVVFHKCRNVFANFSPLFRGENTTFVQFRQSFSPCLTMLRHLAKLCTIKPNNRRNQSSPANLSFRSCFVLETLQMNKVNKLDSI